MLRIVAAVPCVLLALLAPAAAQKWPERTVRIIVPYNAGGGTDLVARVLAQTLGGGSKRRANATLLLILIAFICFFVLFVVLVI